MTSTKTACGPPQTTRCIPAEPGCTSSGSYAGSDRDGDLGHDALGGGHGVVDRDRLRGERTQGPLAGAGEEPELPGRRRGNLSGELARAVEQPDVRVADRLAVTRHDALDHGLVRDVDAVERRAALDRAAHQATPASSPRATGTLRSEPYSLHDP